MPIMRHRHRLDIEKIEHVGDGLFKIADAFSRAAMAKIRTPRRLKDVSSIRPFDVVVSRGVSREGK